MTPSFNGFPAESIQFLHDLTLNNNKTWFEEHKKVYLDSIQKPALGLIGALGERLQQQFPDVGYDTRTNGSGSLMRIHRDVRFSADKSPYKTEVAMMFPSGNGKKMEAPAFGLHMTTEMVELMVGIFGFSKPMLEVYRQVVLNDVLGADLEAAVEKVRSAGNYKLGGETYKRVPSGYDVDHPRAHWLKFTGLYFFSPPIGLEIAQTPLLVDVVMEHFVKMAPIQRCLVIALA